MCHTYGRVTHRNSCEKEGIVKRWVPGFVFGAGSAKMFIHYDLHKMFCDPVM